MARITPKTNWVANDIPVANDLNRIENNNQQSFSEIDQEVSDRQAAITTEQNARISADNTLQNNIDAANSARISADNTLQNNINGKANNAVIGNNGGVGSIVDITSTFTFIGGQLYRHTWTMPHSGVWLNLNVPVYFNGLSYIQDVISSIAIVRTFWRIG
jgi:hypothetical protein